jgi:lipopolysaccharide transport protein LptA
MKRCVWLLILLLIARGVCAQTIAAAASPIASKPKEVAKKPKEAKNKLTDSKPEGPITTEIYAEEAFFDSSKNIGVFTGNVKVIDPRFNMQSEKLTVYLHRGEDQGLDKAVAEGNVGIVRDRPNPEGGPPERAIGRADHVVYTTSDGNAELTGNPKVQQGTNLHIATSPETVMIITQDGQLTTHGPSRTEIRQEPNNAPKTSPPPKQ